MNPADESPVTQLFDEYRRARDEGREVDVGGLLQRAGSARRELEGRIQVFEQLSSVSKELRAELEERKKPPVLGRFQIQRALGKGGLSRVYLALDPKLGRTVALKVLDRSFLRDAAERLWILNEARSLARLAHPGVVQVFDVGEADGFDFVEMEHLTGPTLGQVLRALRSQRNDAPASSSPSPEVFAVARTLLDLEARVRLLHRLASALAYCHDRGVIHRDVKPDNVLLDRDGTPKLVDFGLAHQESEGAQERPAITEAFIGTRAYLAPEQVAGKRTGADPRSDQFSLATLAYEFLSLAHPFAGASDAETEAAVARAEPERLRRANPRVSRELELVIHRGLERLPDVRYPNVQALADDLAAILEDRPVSVAPPTLARRARLFARRHRAQVALGAVALASLLAVGTGFWAMGAIGERMHIESDLAALDVAACRTPSEFSAAAQKLITLRDTARTCDGHLYCRWFASPLSQDVRETIHAWSEHLGEAYAASNHEEQDGAWRLLFELDESLCPEFTLNQALRDRGKVVLPAAEPGERRALLRMIPARNPGEIVAFEEVSVVEKPSPGSYQALYWKEGATRLEAEASFVVAKEWDEKRVIARRRPDPVLLQRAVAISRSEVPHGTPVEPRTSRIRGFRVLPGLVTVGEFRRFLEETSWTPGRFDPREGDDRPAWVDLESATRYASWVGGRLPSNEEIWAAFARGALELDWAPSSDSKPYTSEWVYNLNRASFDGCLAGHARLIEGRPPVETLAFNPGVRTDMFYEGRGGTRTGVSFRVAFSGDAPEAYLQPLPKE